MSSKKKLLSLAFAFAALPCSAAFATEGTCSVSLTQDPLVMRLGKDEFRIAFGLDGAACQGSGCNGTISYDTTWQDENGNRTTERHSVSYAIPNGAQRSLSVDRNYFDDGEAQHTTDVVSVSVDKISCGDAGKSEIASR